MVIFEPKNRLEVTTPKGKGIVWLVTDYGHETDTIYTIILDDYILSYKSGLYFFIPSIISF
jgi:hypothetical protein